MINRNYISLLQEFQTMTHAEFSRAIKVVNGIYENPDILSKLKEQSETLLSIVAKLQYLDIITQRAQHLVRAHDEIVFLYIDDIFKESFLRLQYFQFSMLAYDLLDAITTVEQSMENLSQAEPKIRATFRGSLFLHAEELEGLTEAILFTLEEQYRGLKPFFLTPLTSRQVSICRKLYTMDSERIVLNWYLRNMPLGKYSELLTEYVSQTREADNENIEFF